ncbi:MAG: galactose mutarotase, partial [Methylobacteriaceae bacterium]|nr:galactose mutarotase [Methylobacteriaceae bacterium]
EAKVINWGAALRDLRVPHEGGLQRVVLGLTRIEDYVAHSPHMGAIAGRFANRIRNGRFSIDGADHALSLNQEGRHSLHGGVSGFGKRPWKIGAHEPGRIQLTLHSADGDNGYPGALDVSCVYTLVGAATLRVELTATTDAPTIVNLATHSYFNLDGSPDVRDHELQIAAGFMTPVDSDLIPTGEIVSVAGTPFDFRAPRLVRHGSGQRYDHNFAIARRPDPATRLAHLATLRSRFNGLGMELHSTEPGLQFYDGAKLAVPVAGHDGATYRAHAGLCLEPQVFPDSPNYRHFPDATLRPGQTYSQITEYRFG